MTDVLIVPTGTANTASVLAAFRRLGLEPRLEADPVAVAAAERVVLPGVGAFAAAAASLDALGLRAVLRERAASGRALLAICLGFQLLCEASEESPGVPGLGVIPATARRFDGTERVPQLGWNRIEPVRAPGDEPPALLEAGHVYFANSYRVPALPPGWSGAVTDYGGRFASAVERGPLLACQFHPELSGAFGAALLHRWVARSRIRTAQRAEGVS